MIEREVGDRVVVSWRRREFAGTVVGVRRTARTCRYHIVTDDPYDGDARDTWLPDYQVCDEFNDGRRP